MQDYGALRAMLLDLNLRDERGADSAIGRCHSNLMEMTEKYLLAEENSDQQRQLEASIARTKADLDTHLAASRAALSRGQS